MTFFLSLQTEQNFKIHYLSIAYRVIITSECLLIKELNKTKWEVSKVRNPEDSYREGIFHTTPDFLTFDPLHHQSYKPRL